jgi:L,D-transpeptidase catalytic domain
VTRPAAVASVKRVVKGPSKTPVVLAMAGLLLAHRVSSAEETVHVEAAGVSAVATGPEHAAAAPADAIVALPRSVPAVASVDSAAFCPSIGDVVAVIARKRELWLCHEGAPEARIPVALGQRGLDKRRKADGRTPIGTYTLGTPRPSGRFGIFIPIDYPTPEQVARGLTGAGVGIHGPPRGKTEPEYPTTAVDWTLGCVATGTDSDIEAIAEFVRQKRPLIVIH